MDAKREDGAGSKVYLQKLRRDAPVAFIRPGALAALMEHYRQLHTIVVPQAQRVQDYKVWREYLDVLAALPPPQFRAAISGRLFKK